MHVQHQGTDAGLLNSPDPKQAMIDAAKSPHNGLARLLDVVFALDQVEAMQRSDELLRGRIDLKKMAVAGHNLGAWTAMVAGGVGLIGKDGEETALPDPRLRATIALLPPAPAPGDAPKLAYDNLKVPLLTVCGSRQDGPPGGAETLRRLLPFDHVAGVDQYLVTLEGADGAALWDRQRGAAGGEKDALFQALARTATTAFLDAYLKGNAAARAWLRDGGLEAALAANGKLEKKLK